ncbi:FKBP-type peptidyl-prolyl cis-trans isomerase [Hyalangium rubrum]|uniref:Peptidyl-prolyl cis-trans isomerase n=1 Tax=Hyalangium rubrum TaxID=3103134 RepID=A0ABU5HBE1_9BACT|nr:FKBP-type peptidyl-prolyl cis-trans isomerase [Hyalangium sp. s54d21]MDY7230143.1 FKBP-type peptidyl-prolyl cis-trans isomerase [Hyalangium sp. s54d21]
MRKLWVLAVALAVAGCQKPTENKSAEGGANTGATTTGTSTGAATGAAGDPQTEDQKTLYALGLSIGRSVAVFGLSPQELDFVKAGITAEVTGQKAAVEIATYGPKIQTLAVNRQSAKASAEKEKGKAFLEQAAKEPGAVKTESGLIYKETQAGTGAAPTPTDIVRVHYKGTLIDGKEFDSSFKRNEPATFPLNGVIRCWTEGLQKMKVGGKARLVCPSEIAYGDRGAPPDIPGGATLIFEVELLEATKNPSPTPPMIPMNTPGVPQGVKPGSPPPGGQKAPPPTK